MASILVALGLGAAVGYWYKTRQSSSSSANLSAEYRRVKKENTKLKYKLFVKIFLWGSVAALILLGGLRVYKHYSPQRYEAMKVFLAVVVVIVLLLYLLWLSKDYVNIMDSNVRLEVLERQVGSSSSFAYNITINILSMPCNNTFIFPASFCAFMTIIVFICYVLFWKM